MLIKKISKKRISRKCNCISGVLPVTDGYYVSLGHYSIRVSHLRCTGSGCKVNMAPGSVLHMLLSRRRARWMFLGKECNQTVYSCTQLGRKKLSEALVILIDFTKVTELPFKNPENS